MHAHLRANLSNLPRDRSSASPATTVGNATAGFSTESDSASVRVVAWGFWSADVGLSFNRTVQDACKLSSTAKELILDMSDLNPMRDEGQESFARLVAALPALGIERATVITASHLTKLQLLRLTKANDLKQRVQFVQKQ